MKKIFCTMALGFLAACAHHQKSTTTTDSVSTVSADTSIRPADSAKSISDSSRAIIDTSKRPPGQAEEVIKRNDIGLIILDMLIGGVKGTDACMRLNVQMYACG